MNAWTIDADGDLRFTAPDGTTQHLIVSDLEFDPANPDHFGRLDTFDALVAYQELVQLVKDGQRWRELYQTGTAATATAGPLGGALAVWTEMATVLEQADPAEKIAWRAA